MPTISTWAPAALRRLRHRGQVVLRSCRAAGRAGRRCRRARSRPASGWCCAQQGGQARAAAGGGVAADAGVDHRGAGDLLARQPLLAAAPPSRCRAAGRTRPRGCRPRPGSSAAARRALRRQRGQCARAGPSSRAALQCASQRRRARHAKNSSSSMSEPIIAVEHLTKRVTDSTGTLTFCTTSISRLARARDGGHRRRLGLGQEHAAVDHRRARHAHAAARCGWPAPTCSRSTRTTAPRCARRRSASCSRASSCWATSTALENVMLPLELQGRNDARAPATEMLERVGLGERLGHYPRGAVGRRAAARGAGAGLRRPAGACCWPTSRPAASTSPPARR